jgi:hypothetical protein
MKPTFRSALVTSSLVLLVACGGAQPAPKGPAREPSSTPTAPPIAMGTPDLSPVAPPTELVALGRLSDPGMVMDTAASWAKLPTDIRTMIRAQEPELAQVLMLDAPAELAVTLDPGSRRDMPELFAVVSVGLKSVDGAVAFAKKQGHSVRMVKSGVYTIAKDGPQACAIAASIGKAPARLVCGERPEDVDALLAYATRGLPNENMGTADLHIELRVEPLRRRYSKELRQLKSMALPFLLKEWSLDSPRFDRALADAAHGVVDELLALADDVDRIALDGHVNKDAGRVDSTMTLKFKGQGSWIVQTMMEASKRAKGVPDSFWKLPKDSALASYAVGASAKRYDAIRNNLAELVGGALEKGGAPRKIRDQVGDLIRDMWTTEGAVVSGHGNLPTGGKPSAGSTPVREQVKSAIGWYVFGFDESSTKYKSYFDKWVKLWNDAQPEIQKSKLLKLASSAANGLGVRGTQPEDLKLPKLASRAGKGLPPGSTVYEVELPGSWFAEPSSETPMPGARPAKPVAAPNLPIVMVLVPDGRRSWVGLSTDEKLISAKLREAVKGGGLSARGGLGALQSAPGLSGGYLTLEDLVGSLASSLGDVMGAGNVPDLKNAMPHKGESPVVFWTSVTNDGPTVNWSFQAPQAAIEDLFALGGVLIASAKGSPPPAPLAAPAARTR